MYFAVTKHAAHGGEQRFEPRDITNVRVLDGKSETHRLYLERHHKKLRAQVPPVHLI